MEYWGKHLLIDGRMTNIEVVKDKELIKKFVEDLVVKIDMVPYGQVWIEHFATHDPDKAGISFIQMIETSNISGHFVDKDGSFYLDVFSCKDFNEQDVLDLMMETFGMFWFSYKIVMRDANAVTHYEQPPVIEYPKLF